MLLEEYSSILSVQSRQSLHDSVGNFISRMGFDKFAAMVITDRVTGETEFRSVNNTPAEYLAFWQDRTQARCDPVMQHCKRSSRPIAWNQETYIAAGFGEKWETQARYGYKTGIAVSLHLPRGRHFFIGVDRDQALPSDASELTRMVAGLHLFAAYANEVARRVLSPETEAYMSPLLTPRELESLRWTMEGKTAWEVGRIMSISEQTANRHVNSATHKLDCVNKYQAVLKALNLGLLQ